jgi:hypothetical protein
MPNKTDEANLDVLIEIRNWIRAAAYGSVKASLETALPDAKSRMAYQMLDGGVSMEQVRKACKMSPNALLALANRCCSMGLLGINTEKKRMRLFDLRDFGLFEAGHTSSSGEEP